MHLTHLCCHVHAFQQSSVVLGDRRSREVGGSALGHGGAAEGVGVKKMRGVFEIVPNTRPMRFPHFH